MIKRLGFIVFLILFIASFAKLVHFKASAADSNQTETSSTTTFTIQGGNGNDAYDENGNAVLKPNQTRGYNVITLNAALNGRTAELPVGTLIFLRFPTGDNKISITPAQGIVERAKGIYNLSKDEIALLKVVGQGTATISVTTTSVSSKGTKNAADYSQDWSGYHRASASGSFNDITSKWTVPTASSCASGDTYSSTWTGIDDGTDSNHDLIQTGTRSDCLSNSPSYHAWWEILPAAEQPLNTTTYPVAAGDQMSAEVKLNSGTSWTITIQDITQNWTFSTNQTYSGPQSTSEWIVERPTVNGSPATLTNYGTVTFTNDTRNGANPQHSYTTDSLNMTSDGTSTGTVLSAPSNPNSTTDGFTNYYCGSSTGCSTSWDNNSPTGTGNDSIYAMAASSGSSVWAGGYERISGYGQAPVTWLNTGSGWTKYLPPLYGNSYQNHWLYGIAGSSTDAWTVGTAATDRKHTLAYHWNGTSWSLLTSDDPSSTQGNQLNSVGIDGSGNVFAVGWYYDGTLSQNKPLLEKWNGTKFAQQTISQPSGVNNVQFNSVAFSSSTNGWAVGTGLNGSNYTYVIYHYDGSSWTPTANGSSKSNLLSVATVSDNEAWAVGAQGTNGTPFIMHYTSANGWQEDTSFNSHYPAYATLYGVGADSSSDVWIGGWWYSTKYVSYTMHYNGSTWTQISTPTISGSSILQSVSVKSGVAWAGGYFGTVGTSTPTPLVLQSK